MIFKASERGSPVQLAKHLMNDKDNDHIEVHSVQGFIADDVLGAMQEIEWLSRGCRSKKPLFSVSLSPPQREQCEIDVFEHAIDEIEKRNGLVGQPRLVVFHEKEGRRHAHAVWSRIDAENLNVRNLSHYKNKLFKLSKEIYLDRGWRLPDGYIDKSRRNPRTFDLETYHKAKRERRDPGNIVMQAKEAWAITRSPEALSRALESRGLYLARGDRRAAVVLTYDGEIHSLGRLTGRKAKDLKERFGEDFSGLRSVEDTQKYVRDIIKPVLGRLIDEANKTRTQDMEGLEREKLRMREQHRIEREQLEKGMAARQETENRLRAGRIRTGLSAIWDRATGAYARIRAENEREAMACLVRDRQQRQSIIDAQLKERQVLQDQLEYTRRTHEERLAELHADMMRQRQGVDHEKRRAPAPITPEFKRATKPDFDWHKSRQPLQERAAPHKQGRSHER